MKIAYRSPLPGTTFSVGATIASTSTLAGVEQVHLSRGESTGGIALFAVTGTIVVEDRVRRSRRSSASRRGPNRPCGCTVQPRSIHNRRPRQNREANPCWVLLAEMRCASLS